MIYKVLDYIAKSGFRVTVFILSIALILTAIGAFDAKDCVANEFVPLEIKYQAERMPETQELEKFLEENTLDGYEEFDMKPFDGHDLDAICEEENE